MTGSGFHYAAYGLTVRSGIVLPFRSTPPNGPADVTVRVGRVANRPAAPTGERPWRAAADAFRLDVDGVVWETVAAAEICREGITIVARALQREANISPALRPKAVLLSWILRAIEWPYVFYRWCRLVWLLTGKAA